MRKSKYMFSKIADWPDYVSERPNYLFVMNANLKDNYYAFFASSEVQLPYQISRVHEKCFKDISRHHHKMLLGKA